MSLKSQGVLERDATTILLINGAGDTQVPVDDLYLTFTTLKGAIKEAWVNPKGFHMGRSSEWPVQRIRTEVVVPFMMKHLKAAEMPATTAAHN
jgi:hypothetical protein